MNKYFLRATTISFLFTSLAGLCQSIPQMHLNAQTFTPSTFTPTPYTPQTSDYSILQKSIEKAEDREREANELYLKLIDLCKETAEELGPENRDWFNHYQSSIFSSVEELIELGYFQSAIKQIYESMSNLRNDKEITYRIDSWRNYMNQCLTNQINYSQGKVSPVAYAYWCTISQYKFTPEYNYSGQLIGYKPCSVPYLYESINWDSVKQYITSQGKDNVEHLWQSYFSEPTHYASLKQEFDVSCFVYDTLSKQLSDITISDEKRTNLNSTLNDLKWLLFDSAQKPSFATMTEKIRNQIKDSIPIKSKGTKSKNSKSRHSKRKHKR